MTYQDIDEQIKYSANYDVPGVEIEDYVPENLIKIYPYRAVYGKANRPLIQPNAVTYVRISNTGVDDFQHLKTDDNGKLYLEMFYALKEDTKITNSSGLATFEDELRKVKQFSVLTNDYISQDTEKPDFFTVGRPFDVDQYKNGLQSVYYANDFQPTYANVIDDLVKDPTMSGFLMEDHSRVATATFLDTTEMTSTSSNSKIIFTEDTSLGNSPVNLNGDAGFTLRINNGSLLHSVKAHGIFQTPNSTTSAESVQPLELRLKDNFMTPVKMTPVNTKDKLEMFADWYDYDIALPYLAINQFAKPSGMSIADLVLPYVNHGQSNTMRQNRIDFAVPSAIVGGLSANQTVTVNLFDKSGTLVDGVRITNSSELEPNENSAIGYDITMHYHTIYGSSGQFDTSGRRGSVLGSYTFNANTGALTYTRGGTGMAWHLDKFWVEYTTKPTVQQQATYPFNNIQALMLIEDLLILSAGYADNWTNMPRIANGTDTGKIQPNLRIGWMAWNISDLVNRSPQDMLDSVIESYMRKYPTLFVNQDDMQTMKSLICALSRYIYSSYTIGKGGNQFNELYLPWYLEALGNIEYWSNQKKVKVYAGSSTPAADTDVFFLPGVKFLQTGVSIYDSNNIQSFSTIKFIAKSQYFRKGFSKTGDYRSSSTLELPETLNVSSMKVLQSDRKITTTELDDTISPINKLPLPGDISTNSSEDLNYLFWSPISDYENMYLSNYSNVQTVKAGTTVNLQLPASDFGSVWTVETLKRYIHNIAPGAVIGIWDPGKGLDSGYINNLENAYLTQFLSDNANAATYVQGKYDSTFTEDSYGKITGMPAFDGQDSVSTDPLDGKTVYWRYKNDFTLTTGDVKWDEHIRTYGETLDGYPRFGSRNGTSRYGDDIYTYGTYSQFVSNSTDPKYNIKLRIKNFLAQELNVSANSIVLQDAQKWTAGVHGWTYTEHRLIFEYSIATQVITQPITITYTSDRTVPTFQFTDVPVLFNRNTWLNFLHNFNVVPNDLVELNINVSDTSQTLSTINEIIITGIFIDKFQITFNGNPTTYILDSLTKNDESITTQRIVFY